MENNRQEYLHFCLVIVSIDKTKTHEHSYDNMQGLIWEQFSDSLA